MSAVDLLAGIIAEGTKVSVASLQNPQIARSLLKHGLLRDAGVIGSVVCLDCDEPHAAPVVFDTGEYGYYCPINGFVSLAREEIVAVDVNLPSLINRLADAFGCRRRKSTPIHGNTWRVGAVHTDHGDVMIYFHPRLANEFDARDLMDALGREMASRWRLIITAQGRLPTTGATHVELYEITAFPENGEGLVSIVDLRKIMGVPESPKTGAPNRFGEKIMALIRSRIADGTALPGRNEEAKAVLTLIRQGPGPDFPTLTTVKGYVSKARAG
ncbi:hypothetical protein [Pseudooceanicola sp.]|uniref:hypothetical protein n=1 Tax=Pseudooceanicola sp. TaxID=1914328 RepID=UPI003511D5EE